MIEIKNLHKSFGANKVLQGINLDIDTGETLAEKISPFDTFLQIIDGNAEIVIEKKTHMLHTGEAIIIPAHTTNFVKANERFKMISTIIRSGYEGNLM